MKRLRRPKLKDGELRVYWGRLDGDSPDIIYEWKGESTMKSDSRMLHYYIGNKRVDAFAKPLFSKMEPSFIEALQSRGYDLTTLRFSIMKKQAQKRYESANPLGGPARMFEAIAERIRSGEDYYAVLADYGVTVEEK